MIRLTETPIINALAEYADTVRFHMPGHKGGHQADPSVIQLLGEKVFCADVTNVPGMDDLHQANGVIQQAQELAAAAFGADQTYFLVNGSSCGLQALVMSVCNPGDEIIVPRNMHRSILSGIILSDARPVFFQPEYDAALGIPLGTAPANLAAVLAEHPEAKAVLIVNPTYHGITSDIEQIAKLVHSYGLPLLVDEAHGPHLCFHREFPQSALAGGADACVQGTHKILSAFTQASMLHLKGERINRIRLEAILRLLQSTSTSYLLLSSLDGARHQMATRGRELLQESLNMAEYLRYAINQIDGLACFGSEVTGRPGAAGIDPIKLTISVKGLNVTGPWVEEWLRKRYRVQVEMSDLFNILLIVTFGNRMQEADLILSALTELAGTVGQSVHPRLPDEVVRRMNRLPRLPEPVLSPREAFLAPVTAVSLRESVSRVSAEMIACYPPGIPVICPGERISEEIIDYIRIMRSVGIHFQGPFDRTLDTIRVVE